MQLRYRGIDYKASESTVSAVDSEIIGKYRGAQLKRSLFNLPRQDREGIELLFLGRRYQR